MICVKNLRFPSRLTAKVGRQGPPGSARAQPRWNKIIVSFDQPEFEETWLQLCSQLEDPSIA